MGLGKYLRQLQSHSTSPTSSESTPLSFVKPDIGHTPALSVQLSDDGQHFSSSQSSSTRMSSINGPLAADPSIHAVAQLTDIKAESLATWLHLRQRERGWTSGSQGEGVVLKRTGHACICWPPDAQNGMFADAIQRMDVKCALTINTRVVTLFLKQKGLLNIPAHIGRPIQILPSMSFLASCEKSSQYAFIREPASLVVWDDDPSHLISRAQSIEDHVINLAWYGEVSDIETGPDTDRNPSYATDVPLKEAIGLDTADEESSEEAPRRIVLIQPLLTAITLILVFSAIGNGWKQIALQTKVDRQWIRLAFVLVAPLQIWLGLFFFQTLATSFFQIAGPISQMRHNTKFFSGKAPRRTLDNKLPHVTIQCPVYKEGLWSVIDPTVKSIQAAILTYEMQGGSSNIFINDDGMQLLPPEQAEERREYYEQHGIGWVARPRHNPKPNDGQQAFVRAGKFKKASNMNYALSVSVRVEDRLAAFLSQTEYTANEGQQRYEEALAQVIHESDGRTWAAGNIRMGDYILLIDSDTRVPVDCFADALGEMEASPHVAIVQFSSGVMNVTTSFFEKGITFFTNLVYLAIKFAVANGDVAPFVGHNAFLRWSAIQDVAFMEDGKSEKYWSEHTVSEDFDMALRLQTSGYVIRLAAYAGEGFREGVSLTVYDELARWEKYAYGCSELIFHPLRKWVFRGPFTPLFRKFIFSNMPFPSKITIMAYIGTYFAIASTWVLTVANYFLVGWYNGRLDHYYIDSFKIYFAVIMVFTALGNLAPAVLRYRTEERSLFGAIYENFKWVPLLAVFLGGISLHLSQAILSHLFSIDMSWGATAKEASDTSFFQEVPRILRQFKFTFVWCIAMIAVMITLSGVPPLGSLVPYDWLIDFDAPVWPLVMVVAGHFLLPIALNPGLMLFTW